MTYIYQRLTVPERIRLFKECQRLLIKNHPQSEFIIRRSILSGARPKSLETLVKLYQDFNGRVYIDETCVVFFKIFKVDEGVEEIYKKYDQESSPDGDTVFIVFSTYSQEDADIAQIIQNELDPRVKKIAFSRNGKFKLYPLDKFTSKFSKRAS